MFFRSPRPRSPRRGVTLVEMLVTVALLVLMMSVIVQIFTAATGAVSAARTYQDLDSSLRQIDATIRQDLGNITARMTPPLNPLLNLGYFEYIENSFADNQGEDADDCLRFTAKAPEGQFFTGRFVPSSTFSLVQSPGASGMTPAQYQVVSQTIPITIQSQYAEIIYFLRNGNLYRRVLLIAPERQSAVIQNVPLNNNPGNLVAGIFSPPPPSNQQIVSWLGLNDLSAHPVPSLSLTSVAPATGYLAGTIVLNTLGMLTNRENRYAAPRFCNDFMTNNGGSWVAGSDGVADDYNGDSIPDFWPSLYFNLALASDQGNPSLINEIKLSSQQGRTTFGQFAGLASFAMMGFPYVYPYAYSSPDPTASSGLGWIHSPDPNNSGASILQLNALNHSPLDIGDSLPAPSSSQTWWGFPTWRETMSPNWLDPWLFPGTPQSATQVPPQQATGLNPFSASQLAQIANLGEMLPPMTSDHVGTVSGTAGGTTPYRVIPQLYPGINSSTNKPIGSDTFAISPTTSMPSGSPPDFLWKQVWEDDLILVGLRSFDIKAYDNTFAGYADLGWGNDGRLLSPYNQPPTAPVPITTNPPVTPAVTPANSTWAPTLLGFTGATASAQNAYGQSNGTFFTWPPIVSSGGNVISSGNTFNAITLYTSTLAHEGRMPPLLWDNRPDYQAPFISTNIGDDTTSTIRMRRTWDTWSTDYSNAPAVGVNPANGQPYGLGVGVGFPVYPSYPPPYPAALRGIQIQIRAVDPKNERVKILTIRQDFSDKL